MTDIYTRFISGILFPLQERLKRHKTLQVLREMEQSQWWTPDKIESLRLDRLRHLLSAAAEHVPYYRALFDELGFNPLNIKNLTDIQVLPFLTKEMIRANQETLKADNAQGLARFNTGGSSGQPLIFFIGNERVSHDVAAKWRATRWWGVDIGDREIVVWGSPIELGSQDRIRIWRDKLMRTRLLPAFEMSEAKLAQFVSIIESFRPVMLFGYPSALAHIGEYAIQNGKRLDNIGIKVAFVTSERLYDHQKHIIEQAFGCSVANGYGGRDAGFIAHQCPAGNMHITAEDIIVEIVDSKGNVLPAGQVGEVVVTHLATRDFPFIRYRTGDVAALSARQCSCGRGLPVLERLEGRTTDFVVAQNGTVMHGLALIYVIRDLEGVENFKIVQESVDCCRLIMQVNGKFDHDDEQKAVKGLKARLGEAVDIKVEYVDSVPKEASGKFRYIVSKVAMH